jgi:GNAT superfamily N-acetyltransferase
MAIQFRAVTPKDFPQIERLFGERGACGGCWCMNWRIEKGGKSWDAFKGAPAKRELARLVAAGRVHAVLAFDEETPVGWCCLGPRGDFPRLLRSRVLQRHRDGGAVWAITCFFLDRRYRDRGLGTQILGEAVRLAFARGAAELEGYPVPVSGKKLPGPFAWTGTPPMFARVGFSKVDRPDGARPIWIMPRPA